MSPADYFDYRRDARSFERLSAAQAGGATLAGGERPERIAGLKVSADLYGLLGAALVLIAVAVVAAWLPARRAGRLDPITALRQD